MSEKVLIGTLLVGQVVFAPFLIDLFPFSTTPMFSDAPESISVVIAWKEEGKSRSENIQKFVAPYIANPAPKLSRFAPELSAKDLDQDWAIEKLKSFKSDKTSRSEIVRVKVAPLNKDRVGVISKDRWILEK